VNVNVTQTQRSILYAGNREWNLEYAKRRLSGFNGRGESCLPAGAAVRASAAGAPGSAGGSRRRSPGRVTSHRRIVALWYHSADSYHIR
jgi:hypothetical protein